MAKIASPKSSAGARSSSASSVQDLREEISKVAYQLFEQRGGEHGHDAEDWYRAEQIVKQRRVGRN